MDGRIEKEEDVVLRKLAKGEPLRFGQVVAAAPGQFGEVRQTVPGRARQREVPGFVGKAWGREPASEAQRDDAATPPGI